MAYEHLKASIGDILEEIAARPEDRDDLIDALRRKVSELERMGHAAPAEVRHITAAKPRDDAEDFFDNMPV